MKNPIESLDKLLMSGANAAVHAWNWTTGRTKSDLTSLLMATGSSFLIADSVINPTNDFSYVTTTGYSFVALTTVLTGSDMEQRELNAYDKEMKDSGVESYKLINKVFGLTLAGMAGIAFSKSTSKNPKESSSVLFRSIGEGLCGLGLYVSSANSLPPRKNCISRGLDKLNEIMYRPAYAYARK